MLACLPASGDPAIRLLHRTQMNTGLQKWETTQKMRSAPHPTPAELDAYAKKIADKPLSIQIFPNSIKVPQKKHVRRTVNGLDTTSSAQRHSPYPPHLAAGAGLLAVLRAPPRGPVRQPDGCRTRLQLKAAMNPQSGPYAAPSTLNLPHLAAQKQGAGHPQQSLAHPMALQHHQRSMAHSQALQQQQRLTHPPAVQRQPPPPQDVAPCTAAMPQQHLPHMQTLKHQVAPAQALGATQELRHVPDGVAVQAAPQVPPALPPPPPYGARKLPDADAPPNVTVSTSTIPLSMAASLQQARPGDLSSIVLQINQLCQARAGMGATSVCEGQIANPSPISRNQLISASSRVSQHASGAGGVSSCLLMDKPAAPAPAASGNNNLAAFHPDSDKLLQQHLLQQKQQQQHLQQLQQQQRSWAQHQLAHMQQPPEGAHPCKNPRLDPAAECAFPSHGLSYGHKPPAAAHGFPPKHAADKTLPPSSANCSYLNGHYLQPAWGAVPAAAGSNGNIPQDLPVAFQGGHAAAAERIPGAKYRPGKDGSAGQPKLLQHNVDFLGEDFQIPGMQEQSVEMMHKMHRGGHHHQGYH